MIFSRIIFYLQLLGYKKLQPKKGPLSATKDNLSQIHNIVNKKYAIYTIKQGKTAVKNDGCLYLF